MVLECIMVIKTTEGELRLCRTLVIVRYLVTKNHYKYVVSYILYLTIFWDSKISVGSHDYEKTVGLV